MSDSQDAVAQHRDRVKFVLSMTLVAIAAITFLYAFMVPSAKDYQEAVTKLNTQVSSKYGASEVTASRSRLFITVDGKQFSCYRPSFQDIENGKPIQCEDDVLLEQRTQN